MSKLSNLEYERNRFYKFKDDIIKIINLLNNINENLDNSSIELDSSFTINDEYIDNNIFKTNTKDINKTLKILNETIIPSINNKIVQLNTEIKNNEKLVIKNEQ